MAYKAGIELEAKLKNGVTLDEVISEIRTAGISIRDERNTHNGTLGTGEGWKVVFDGTNSRDGRRIWEFVTDPIHGAKTIEKMVTEMCPILNKYCEVDADCGYHIHFSILEKYHFARRIDTTTEAGKIRACGNKPSKLFVAELIRNYNYFQTVIDAFVSQSRRGNRVVCGGREAPEHSVFTSKAECKYFSERTEGNASDFQGWSHSARYHKVNLKSLVEYGTVEYRQHQGTLNPTKILNWMKLMERMTTRSWDRKYKNLDCRNFAISVDGLFDFLGFGKCSRSLREYFRKRAIGFDYHSIASISEILNPELMNEVCEILTQND